MVLCVLEHHHLAVALHSTTIQVISFDVSIVKTNAIICDELPFLYLKTSITILACRGIFLCFIFLKTKTISCTVLQNHDVILVESAIKIIYSCVRFSRSLHGFISAFSSFILPSFQDQCCCLLQVSSRWIFSELFSFLMVITLQFLLVFFCLSFPHKMI